MTFARVLALSLLSAILLTSAAWAKEKKIQRADLPPAVEKTVAAEAQGATVRGFSEETEKGHTYYEAELVVDGHHKDILIDRDGAIVEVEEQVAIDSLPAGVQQGLKDKAGKGTILEVESLTKHGQLVAYEAQVKGANGKRTEVQVGPDGKSLAHEE
jgi:uncharacterized membrane protein YkoI